MNYIDKFHNAIQALSPHNRFGTPLNQAAAYGVLAGLTDEEIYSQIMTQAPGEYPPDSKQTNDAINFANNLRSNRNHTLLTNQWHPTLLSQEDRYERHVRNLDYNLKHFVQTLIQQGAGATSSKFFEQLALPHPNDPVAQAIAQLQRLATQHDRLIWAGDIGGTSGKRPLITSQEVLSTSVLCEKLQNREYRIPTHISLNGQTGTVGRTKGGTPSYDCLETVSSYDYALIESDTISLPEQACFLKGLVNWTNENHTVLQVMTAVWTGNKSIHIIIKVPPPGPGQNPLAHYRSQWQHLQDLFASSDDQKYRIDISNTHTGGCAATHTRLAGAIRPETGKMARLLYLAPT